MEVSPRAVPPVPGNSSIWYVAVWATRTVFPSHDGSWSISGLILTTASNQNGMGWAWVGFENAWKPQNLCRSRTAENCPLAHVVASGRGRGEGPGPRALLPGSDHTRGVAKGLLQDGRLFWTLKLWGLGFFFFRCRQCCCIVQEDIWKELFLLLKSFFKARIQTWAFVLVPIRRGRRPNPDISAL